MTFAYDADNDVLYVTLADAKGGVRYVETERGDVVRFSEETGQILGVTVMFLAARTQHGEAIDLPEVSAPASSARMSMLVDQEPVLSKPTY